MDFQEGEACLSGPRNATIVFECGREDKLIEVNEPSVCVYMARFSTPSACQPEALRKMHEDLVVAAEKAGLPYEMGEQTKQILADGWR